VTDIRATPAAQSITRNYASMTVANLIILCLTALSYIIYSRLLTPTQFAVFGTALTCSRVCVMLLDGGIRNVLIADRNDVDRQQYSAISATLFVLSLGLIAIGYAVTTVLESRIAQISFVLLYVVPFLVSYSLFFSSMVRLERRLSYGRIAIVETLSTLIELALPAVLILATGMGLYAFIIAAFASRILRTACFWLFAPPAWATFGISHVKDALLSIRTSLWFQFAILSSAIRDNLPILLVAPFFGTQWAGYYVWALQICSVSSQFAVATASRIALPVISGHDSDHSRYDVSIQQIRWLSKLLGPVLVGVWLMTPILNTLLFHDRWTPALALLPWLLLRMMPGIATTILAPLTFVQFGPRWLAMVSTGWTLIELASAWIMLHAFGPIGLAYSYALCVWCGVALMISKIRERSDFRIIGLFRTIMLNPALLGALTIGVGITMAKHVAVDSEIVRAIFLLIATGAMVVLSYQMDADLREKEGEILSFVRTRLRQRKDLPA
jgi:teichuronic acid exporter